MFKEGDRQPPPGQIPEESPDFTIKRQQRGVRVSSPLSHQRWIRLQPLKKEEEEEEEEGLERQAKTSSSLVFTRLRRGIGGGMVGGGVVCAHGFPLIDLGFEMFNTRKTPSLVKRELQRAGTQEAVWVTLPQRRGKRRSGRERGRAGPKTLATTR